MCVHSGARKAGVRDPTSGSCGGRFMSKPEAFHRPIVALLLMAVTGWAAVPISAQTQSGPAPTDRRGTLRAAVQKASLEQPTSASIGTQTPPPPIMTFPPEGLGIEDAVRLTLENDPELRLQAETVRFREGVVQEQAGPFDSTVLGTVAYDYRKTNLTSASINAGNGLRNTLASSIPVIQQSQASAQTTLNLLEQARNGPLAGDSVAALAQL